MHVAIDIFCILIFAPRWAFFDHPPHASLARRETRKRIIDMQEYGTDTGTGDYTRHVTKKQNGELMGRQ